MALTIQTINLHTGRQNPWAYEIPVTFQDTDGKDHNIVMVFKTGEPTQLEIDNMVDFWKTKLETAESTEEIIAEDGTVI